MYIQIQPSAAYNVNHQQHTYATLSLSLLFAQDIQSDIIFVELSDQSWPL